MSGLRDQARRLMAEREMSMRRLAATTGYDLGFLSRALGGKQNIPARMARAIDQALDAGGSLAALLPATGHTEIDEERLRYVAQHPRRVDARALDALAVVLAGQRRLEDAIGTAPLIRPTTGQLAVIEALVVEARGKTRPLAVDVAAQWAQFLAWLHASLGKLAPARAWFDRAAEWSAEAGNADMAATVLSFRGYLAWKAGHIGPMIGLSEAAKRDRAVYVGQRAYDAGQQALGHTLAGNRRAAAAAVGEAAELAAATAAQGGQAPPWQYYRIPAFFRLERGLVHRHLGREDPTSNEHAIDLLSSGLAELPTDMRRSEWAAEYALQLSLAHAQNGDRQAAAAVVEDSAQVAAETGSARLSAQTTRLTRRLGL